MSLKWPFLLMYGSHDMRHTGFRGLTSCQRDPRDSGHHIFNMCCMLILFLSVYLVFSFQDIKLILIKGISSRPTSTLTQ